MNTDIPSHHQIWELLPWIINGTATPEQRRLVDSHLPHCMDCRDELALQRLVHDGMNRDASPGNPRAALHRHQRAHQSASPVFMRTSSVRERRPSLAKTLRR